MCCSTYTYKFTETAIKYYVQRSFIYFYLRILLFLLMFFWPTKAVLMQFINNLSILRAVFLSSTISLHTIMFINYFKKTKYVKNEVKLMNRMITIWEKLNSLNQSVKERLINRKAYFFEIFSLTIIIIILCHQDYERKRFKDTLSYTFYELLLLKSIYQKVNILSLLATIFDDLNKESEDVATIEELHSLTSTYNDLVRLGREINKSNGLYCLTVTLNTFIWTTYNLYKFIVITLLSFSKFPTLNVKMSMYLSFTWTFLQLFHITLMVIACDRVHMKANRFIFAFGDIVNRLELKTKNRHHAKVKDNL